MIHQQSWGDGAQDALLLHHALGSSDAWQRMAGHLAHDLTMTGFDFPGEGQSADWNGMCDYHALCTNVAAGFLTRPMHLIGHSFGATVALRLGLEQPKMVLSLTLIEPVFFAAANGSVALVQHEIAIQPFVTALTAGNREAAAREFTDIWGTGVVWNRLSPTMHRYATKRIHLIPAARPALFGDDAGLLQSGRLEAVGFPVLLLEGDQSPAIIKAINGALAARLPDVRRAQIKGAGHMAPITHAQQVAAKIAGFINL